MWIVGVREVQHVEVVVHEERRASTGRIPGVARKVKRVTNLPREAWERLIHFRVSLPLHKGAGPCGTAVNRRCTARSFAWSIDNLIEPLRAYYETYTPPLRFGAKPGPRGRKVG